MTLRFPWIVLIGVLLWAPGASAHGTEREYGTPINGRGVQETGSLGSPAFAIMALDSNSSAILRALDEGRASEARERVERFPELIRELLRRCEKLDASQREQAREATSAISDCATRIEAAARVDELAVRHELVELRRHLASMQELLREQTPR